MTKMKALSTRILNCWGAIGGAFGFRQGSVNRRFLFIELFVAISLSVTYCLLVEYFASGVANNSTNRAVFSSCSLPAYHLHALGDVWRGRLSGLLLSGWLFDLIVKGDTFSMDQYSLIFGLYQGFWLFLLFLTVILALRNSLLINLGIFAGLMYNFTPASILYFFPWDLPAALFSTLACLFFNQRKTGMMIASVCFGCFFKESVLAFALLFFFISYWEWWKRGVLFLAVLAVYVIGKKLMLHYLALDVAVLPVGNAATLPTLFSLEFLKLNLTTLIAPTWNNVLFVNAGTVVAVVLLGWRRPFLPFIAVIIVFLVVQLMYGGFGEFHTFIQILPLSLILLSERWQENAGSGADTQISPGSAPAWAVRETFPAVIPMTIVVIGLSAGIAGWRYHNIFEGLQPGNQAQTELGKHFLEAKGNASNLAVDFQMYREEDAAAKLELGMIYTANRQFSNAINCYQRVLELDTNSVAAMNNLAWVLATASDPKLRNGREAVRLAERACQLTQNKKAPLVSILAAAYAEAGRFNDAVITAQKARTLALEQGQNEIAARNEQLLKLYESGRAYHQEAKPAP
ncbi:MAG: hypothetical protein WBW41_07230 [Verrucomicrobiia bacterium]